MKDRGRRKEVVEESQRGNYNLGMWNVRIVGDVQES